jgi:hypothetical protein
MRCVYGLAAMAALFCCSASASAASSIFDFEGGTDQGWGTGFGNDASATFTIQDIGGSNRMRVPRTGFQSAGRETGNVAEDFYQAMLAAAADEANYSITYDWYVDTSVGGFGTFLQLGTYVNTGNGYYAQNFPGAGKEVELGQVELESGGVFSGTVSQTFTAKGFDMDPSNTFYRLGVIMNGNGAADVVHFDNIRVHPTVPEPASIALLFSAAAACVGLRRRK